MGSLWYCNILRGVHNKVLIFHSRHLNISSTQLAFKNALSKQGKMFNKLLGSSKKKRKYIFDDSQTLSSGSKLSLGQHIKNNKENSRRIAVLNSVFMKHISDLLVTGNIGTDVLSKGLEISRVSLNPDFSQLNVFWGCHREESIDELENVLPNISHTLRHELSQLRVVGVVPRLLFLKDKHFTNGAKVDYLLRMADFGEAHIPTALESDFRDSSSTPADKNKSPNDEQASSETSTLEDGEAMPTMRHDIFNLDHQLIMNKILKKMQRSRAIHRFEPNLVIKTDGNNETSSDMLETEIMTKQERKEALAKFVLTRRILQEKKMQDKHKSDREIYTAEELSNEDSEDEDYEVEDYIDEICEENKFQN